MPILSNIEAFAQQVAETIASVLGIEVQMIDEQLRLCVGTGIYVSRRDRVFDATSASYYVMQTGKPIVIEKAKHHQICMQCTHRLNCIDLAEICYPIMMNSKPIGVIALIAQKEQQREALLANKEKLFMFIEKMAGLLEFAIRVSDLKDQVSRLMEAQELIMNSIQEGIISLNSQGKIIFINQSAINMLEMEYEEFKHRHISAVFEGAEDILAMTSGKNTIELELFSAAQYNSKHFIGTITPFKLVTGENALVICFRDIKTIPRMVRNYLRKERKITFVDILGKSDTIIGIKKQALQVARNDSSILIMGESGTGKEMFARAIHYASHRSNGPLISINCGAIPEGLLESELFGYEEGAFTGAKKGGKPGQFELANNGTLFLDEIGDMPLHLQVKLLRVLEDKHLIRLGGTRPVFVNVRIIAATNKNIEDLMLRGEFREDLYYRLNVIPLYIPSLRERPEDILVYLEYFISKYNSILNKEVECCTQEVMEYLTSYTWPGNVRELENVVEYMINMENGSRIQTSSLPQRLIEKLKKNSCTTIKENEKQLINDAIKKFGLENKELIANHLGISKATLYRKLKSYKLYQ